jgi:hypothetical protein
MQGWVAMERCLGVVALLLELLHALDVTGCIAA